MPKFCRQYKYCLQNSAQDFTVCLTASFCIQANCVLILCLCVCVCMCVCVCEHACERERGRTLITLWNKTEYVTHSHEMSLNFKKFSWRYLHVSNLQALLVILIFTAVACEDPVCEGPGHSAKSAGARLQLNTHTPYVCGFAWTDVVHGCMVYTERAEMAAVSCGISHASAVSTPLRWILKKVL